MCVYTWYLIWFDCIPVLPFIFYCTALGSSLVVKCFINKPELTLYTVLAQRHNESTVKQHLQHTKSNSRATKIALFQSKIDFLLLIIVAQFGNLNSKAAASVYWQQGELCSWASCREEKGLMTKSQMSLTCGKHWWHTNCLLNSREQEMHSAASDLFLLSSLWFGQNLTWATRINRRKDLTWSVLY